MTSGNLLNYYRDKVTDDVNRIVADGRLSNNKATTSTSFEYKTKIIGGTTTNSRTLNTAVAAPLNNLSNLWRPLDLSLIIYEIELDLTWSEVSIISEIFKSAKILANLFSNLSIVHPPVESTADASFEINNTKLYVPEVFLSINDNINFL